MNNPPSSATTPSASSGIVRSSTGSDTASTPSSPAAIEISTIAPVWSRTSLRARCAGPSSATWSIGLWTRWPVTRSFDMDDLPVASLLGDAEQQHRDDPDSSGDRRRRDRPLQSRRRVDIASSLAKSNGSKHHGEPIFLAILFIYEIYHASMR